MGNISKETLAKNDNIKKFMRGELSLFGNEMSQNEASQDAVTFKTPKQCLIEYLTNLKKNNPSSEITLMHSGHGGYKHKTDQTYYLHLPKFEYLLEMNIKNGKLPEEYLKEGFDKISFSEINAILKPSGFISDSCHAGACTKQDDPESFLLISTRANQLARDDGGGRLYRSLVELTAFEKICKVDLNSDGDLDANELLFYTMFSSYQNKVKEMKSQGFELNPEFDFFEKQNKFNHELKETTRASGHNQLMGGRAPAEKKCLAQMPKSCGNKTVGHLNDCAQKAKSVFAIKSNIKDLFNIDENKPKKFVTIQGQFTPMFVLSQDISSSAITTVSSNFIEPKKTPFSVDDFKDEKQSLINYINFSIQEYNKDCSTQNNKIDCDIKNTNSELDQFLNNFFNVLIGG
jgi:hypothetical protein